MRILAMTATFGKLEGDTLRLEPGLNVISAPNEWGKSTWCAFLTAMLYGVETRERTTKDQLAEKDKYMPWSGRPMEGLLRVEHEDRDITIQRRTKGRIPLGEFQAYETRTGLAVPELTGENCGMVLLGVERSVFQRTGFIRFDQLSVGADEHLWNRLRSSVTEEESEATVLEKKLRELKTKCRSPRGGLIPAAQRNLEELEEQYRQRQSLEQKLLQLDKQSRSAQLELEALERHRNVCRWREARNHREQTDLAVQAAKDARAAVEELEARCVSLPPKEELTEKLEQAQSLMDELRQVPEEMPPSPLTAVIPGVLAVLSAVACVFCLFQRWYLYGGILAAAALALGSLAGFLWDRRRAVALKQRTEQLRRERAVGDLVRTIENLRRNLSLQEELESARRTAEQTRIRLQSMVASAKEASEAEQEDDLDLTTEETEERIGVLTQRLKQNQLLSGQCLGRMELLPERENLLRQQEREQLRLRELERYEKALEQGLSALEEASLELQRRFAPRITALAQEYLERLTGGRYNRLSVGQDLTARAASREEITLREGKWRSDGTADQMALALRLAMWMTLNPNGPLVLDDALIRLDDTRLGYAMELLKELGRTRQILLFSCQKREQKWL